MAEVYTTKTPPYTVTNLTTPTRKGNEISASWKVPSNAVDKSKRDRFTGLEIRYTLDVTKTKKDQEFFESTVDEKKTSESMRIDWTKRYPNSNVKIDGIIISVRGWNKRKNNGKKYYGPWKVSNELMLTVPRKPTFSDFTYEVGSTGHLSITINANIDKPDTTKGIRTDTTYTLTLKSGTETLKTISGKFTGTSKTVTYDLQHALALVEGQYYEFTIAARNRGPKGDSDEATKKYVVAFPGVPSIVGSPTLSGKDADSRLDFAIKTNKSSIRPTENVYLQRIKNIDPSVTSQQINSYTGWEDVDGQVDDGECKGLHDTYPYSISNDGKYTWYRIRAHARGYDKFSNPWKNELTFNPAATAADDYATILSLEDDEITDEPVFIAKVGWKNDDSTGTELSWSTDWRSWNSNKPPETIDINWIDGAHSSTWPFYAKVTIFAKDKGVPVYCRVRRYLDGDNGREYGPYSEIKSVIVGSKAKSLSLNAPFYGVIGSTIALSWTYSGPVQKSWKVISATTGKTVASGTGSRQAALIPVPDGIDSEKYRVSVSTGESTTLSENEAEVRFIGNPTLVMAISPSTFTPEDADWYQAESLTLPSSTIMGKQGLDVSLTCGMTPCDVVIKVISHGTTPDTPNASVLEEPGDVVWSARVYSTDEWVEGLSGRTKQLTIPFLPVTDHATYTVEAYAEEPISELRSATQEADFSVLWAHQAQPCEAVVSIGDEDVATIAITAPENAVEGDRIDVYRGSLEDCYLIARELPASTTIYDAYPPFASDESELFYRICTRTEDGDTEWTDIVFENDGAEMVIDWAGSEQVRLPYNLEFSPSFTKGFEQRIYLDGSIEGYWDSSVSMEMSASLVVEKSDNDTHSALMMLASYPGTCLVRLPNGMAFPADVQMQGETFSCESGVVATSFNFTRVGMIDEFEARSEL